MHGEKTMTIPAELRSAAQGGVVTSAEGVFDYTKGKSQEAVNADIDTALDDRYTKSETYNKTELNNLITTPNQEYVTVADYASLPATGSADTIYRVSNYDGEQEQVDATRYSEYSWDGTQYILLSVKSAIGEVFDISAYHSGQTYADLAAALDSNNGGGVPQSLQKGGMSVKFVQTSDNKYVQYRLISQNFNTTPANWQKLGAEVSVSQNTSTGHTEISVGSDTHFVASAEDVEKLFPILTGTFIWSNGYIDFTTGNYVAQANYRSTQKLSKDIREIITNIEHLGVDSFGIYRGSHLSFWNNGVYVGYMYQNVVKDPSGTTLADIPTYDTFVINEFNTYDPSYATNIKLEIKYATLVINGGNFSKAIERNQEAIQEIVSGFVWGNSYYNYTTGTRTAESTYRSTQKMPKDLKDAITNIDHLGVDSTGVFRGSHLSYWNNGVYVGYMEQGVVKDPSGATLANIPEYDEFAINAYYTWNPNYDKNIIFKGLVFFSQDIDSLKPLISENTRSISVCVDGLLKWITGAYYDSTDGSIKTSEVKYSCSKIYQKAFYDENISVIDNLFVIDNWTQISYWKEGVYVGYRIANGYHLPDGTEVESIDFDEFAINLGNVQIPDYQTSVKFVSLSSIKNNNKSFDKDFYALGDSTTYGAGSSQSPVKSWSDYLNEIAVFKSYTKLAISGAHCYYHEGYGRLSAEIDNVPANTTGIVTIMIGTNDFFTDDPLGNANDALALSYSQLDDTTNFAVAFRYCLEKLKRKAKDATIIVIMPLPSYDANDAHGHLDETNLFAQRDIQRTICNAMGIPIVESQYEFGLSRYTDNWNYFFNDFCHPNDVGYQRIAHCMLGKFIEFCQ